jgi:hypothetical protein
VPTREGWSQQASLAGDTLTVVFTDKDMTRDNVALSALEKVRFGTDEERIWFDLKDAYAPEVTLLFWTDTSGDHEQEILKSLARHVKERPSIADARTVAELQRAIIAGE